MLLNDLTNIDWIDLFAVVIALITLSYTAWFNRRTLKMTIEQNRKSVEPSLSDDFSINLFEHSTFEDCYVSHKIKNCGIGPAKILHLEYKKDGKVFANGFDLLKAFIGDEGRILSPKNYVRFSTISSFEILSTKDELLLFKIYIEELEIRKKLNNWLKTVEIFVIYESIYSERKEFSKPNIVNNSL